MKTKMPENLTVAGVYMLVDTLHQIMRENEDGSVCRFCAYNANENECTNCGGCSPLWIGLVEEEQNT